eukprot:CAMPEP_0197020784 /NCGR_PEP_ID=MMETSP1384-20130603/1677_1 /TAXON_ID=29189 /ORGANISM="Ammonia sp." /LENGTH=165 /DNA_ID=CAMNT_0042448473 /DNA_START=83 /DNA_END=580 /DNA_ORIENTATION=+
MMKAAILLVLIGAAYAQLDATEVKVTVSNCTKSTDEGKINTLTLSPASPEKVNENFTITGTGISGVAISGGTYKAVAKIAGITVFTQSGDLCKPDTIKLPDNVGTIYYEGVSCPVAKNAVLVVKVTANVSPSAPDQTVKISVTTTDAGTNNEIVCIDSVATPTGR